MIFLTKIKRVQTIMSVLQKFYSFVLFLYNPNNPKPASNINAAGLKPVCSTPVFGNSSLSF